MNSVSWYLSTQGPAGDPTDDPVRGCLNNNVLQSSRSVAANTVDKFTLPSCNYAGRTLFIGVKGSSSNANSTFIVGVSQQDPTPAPTVLPAPGQSLSATQTYYTTTPNSLTVRSYITFQTSNLNPSSSKPDLSKWTTTSDCQTYDTSYCDPDSSATTCSAIVFPCMMATNTQYLFDVTASGVTADLNATLYATPIISSITPGNVITGTVLQHQLAFYQATLPANILTAGQEAVITLESVSCGLVEVWINKATPAGKYCNLQDNVPCNTAPCVLTTLTACRNDDWSDNYFVTVRGLKQNKPDVPIQFSISVAISTNPPTFRMMHSNERHPIYGITTTTTTNTCPAPIGNTPITTCCPVPSSSSTFAYAPEPVNFVYPIEGAHFLEYQNTITLELTPYALTGTLYINTEDPYFCRTDPTLPTCSVDFNNPTCTVQLNPCQFRDVRHIFISASIVLANNISIDPRFVNNQLPIAHILNNREQYSITGVDYSDTVKYLQFALIPGEVQYIVVQHPTLEQLASIPNYHFTAKVVSVLGYNSRVELYPSWDMCSFAPICGDSAQCQSQLAGVVNSLCSPLTPCECYAETLPCQYGVQLNINNQSFIRVQNNGTEATVAKIQMQFLEVENLITPDCQNVTYGDDDWYLDSQSPPSPTQYWRFSLQFYQDFSSFTAGGNPVAGNATLTVNENTLALPGTCADDESCSVTSQTPCYINHRRDGTPHAVVTGVTTTTHYRINSQLITVTPYTLSSTIPHTSPYVDTSGSCPTSTYNQWYIFPQAQIGSGNYMFVELSGAQLGTTVWMYPGHITYRWGAQYCTVDNTGYCFFIVACNYAKVDYYFHVDSSVDTNSINGSAPVHTITVSSLTNNIMTVSLDSTTTVVLPYHQVQTLQLTLSGTDDTPTKDLHIDYGVTDSSVRVWINRGKWGDPSCAVANFNANPNDPNFVISACDIRETSDVFYISFVSLTVGACYNAPFSVSPKFVYSDSIAVAATTTTSLSNQQVYAGETTRLLFNTGPLQSTDIIYVQLSNILNGNLTHTIWKGNHDAPSGGTSYPCTAPCSSTGPYDYVSWWDVCWHCAVYDHVYVDVMAPFVGPSNDYASFTASVTKASWLPLTATPLTVSFSNNVGSIGPQGNLAFYSADLSQGMSHRIELQVTSGQTVKVEIYGAPCGFRANPITSWCYPNMVCTIPLDIEHNYGSFYPSNQPHPLSPSTAYIVVSGQSTSFTILEATGTAACSPISAALAPTCNTYTLRSDFLWGNSNTFPQKDDRALQRYNEFQTAFSCGGTCRCQNLSQPCLDNLRRYACDESFLSCSDQGYGLRVTAALCAAVENTCMKTFIDAGYPQLSCFHSFYLANAAKWVNATGFPTRPPDNDIDQTINGAAASGAPAGVPAPPIDTSGQGTGGIGVGPVGDAPDYNPGTGASSGNSTGDGNFTSTGFDNSTGLDSGNGTTGASTSNGASTSAGSTSSTGSQNSGQGSGASSGDSGVTGGSSALSGGAIAGIVIGVIAALAIIGGLVYYFVVKSGGDGVYKNFDQT